jgi:hypothetical protein
MIVRCEMFPGVIQHNRIHNHHRPGPPDELFQPEIVTMLQPPATHSLSRRLAAFSLSRTILRRPRVRCVAQKVESLLRIAVPSVGILAVQGRDNPWSTLYENTGRNSIAAY